MKKYILSAFVLCVMAAAPASCAIYVRQPSYHSMHFYVYKPANVPEDFYVTYDGYLVYRDINGVWKYGSSNGNAFTRTDFVVGSVIPSVVGITLWDKKAATVADIMPSGTAVNTQTANVPAVTTITVPAANTAVPQPAFVIPQTTWSSNPNFTAISRWGSSVDRMGVLDRPSMPVAWKGDNPRVVYAWNGQNWRQLNAGSIRRAMNIIRRGLYDLTTEARRINHLSWTNEDSSVLAQYAAVWGYRWLGLITVGNY